MILYHGTSAYYGRMIAKHGFKQGRPNWKVQSKPGFIYLSVAYAPFYTMVHKSHNVALVKVEVPDDRIYPDDDFVMYALKKPVYTQEDLDRIDLEDYKALAEASLNYLGSVCVRTEDAKVLGVHYFDSRRLILICDPSITPMNYAIMGDYYRGLTEALYDGGMDAAMEFARRDRLEKFGPLEDLLEKAGMKSSVFP
jgi:hypothetical protein